MRPSITLVSGFAAPPSLGNPFPGVFASYSLLLNESNWHVGSAVGPAPTQSEFLSVLDTLSSLLIETVGGDPQDFLDNPNLAGLASDSFPNCTTDGWMIGAFQAGCNALYGNPPGSIHNGDLNVGFSAPAAFLGAKLAAYNGSLTFDLAQNAFDVAATGGDVVLTGSVDETCSVVVNPLTGRGQPVCTAATVPEPASLVLLATGMCATALRRRRRV